MFMSSLLGGLHLDHLQLDDLSQCGIFSTSQRHITASLSRLVSKQGGIGASLRP
jgi:hypothetical protein